MLFAYSCVGLLGVATVLLVFRSFFFSFSVAVAICSSLSLTQARQPDSSPFTVPDGFLVERVADDSIVHDCFCMTLDGLGRPVVSGPGYIRTLVDDNKDGIYDRSFLWSSLPKQGAQGLWSEGRKLYFVSDGALWLTEDLNSDLAADANPKRVLELPTGGEHDVHAIRRGPDGFWYMIAGNFARDLFKLQNDPLSPVSRSRSGTIWRISPDFTTRGVWAHGMRNAYDFDFLPDGQIVTFDSDCEREATMPWYRPTRVFVMGPGSDAGWCGQAWKDEDHRITMPQTLVQLGRGSPTGIAVYQHRAFPKKYHDAAFVLDWTFGRVMAVFPSKNLDESKQIPNKVPAEVFMQPSGTMGFAPTDICVAANGSLLVSVGGRGTTGAIYRITAPTIDEQPSYPNWFRSAIAKGQIKEGAALALQQSLTSNMPFDSWSEVKWRTFVDKAGVDPLFAVVRGELEIEASANEVAVAKLRAAQLLTRMNALIPASQILKAVSSKSHSTRAAGWWLAGRGRLQLKPQELNAILQAASMSYQSEDAASEKDRSDWEEHLGPADERLRWEAIGLRKWSMDRLESQVVPDSDLGNSIRRTRLWALARSSSPLSKKSPQNALDNLIAKQLFGPGQTNVDIQLLDVLAGWVPKEHGTWSNRDTLEFLTVLQSSLGDRRHSLPQQTDPPSPNVLDGYRGISASRLPEHLRKAWSDWAVFFAEKAIEQDSPLLNLEATRTLAMLEPSDKESVQLLLKQISDKSHPTSDIHWLCCSANCSAERTSEMTRKTAEGLAGVLRKVKERGLYTDNQWPIRLQQLVTALLKRDSTLGEAFVALPIPCCSEDLLLISSFPAEIQLAAKKKMREQLMSTEPTQWSVDILRYASQAGLDEAFAAKIREASSDSKIRQIAVEILSSKATALDYGLFLSALESKDREQWQFAWKGINELPILEPLREQLAFAPVVFSVLNSNPKLPRALVLQRARSVAKQIEAETPPATEQWSDWERYYKNVLTPESFEQLISPKVSVDWNAVVAKAASMKGQIAPGKVLFQEKCVLCHGGQSSLGPSLTGATKRFSREDLARAIFEPSRDIPDRYRAIRVLTIDEEIFTGLIVYSAADGTTLQTANGTIVRINQDNIEEKSFSSESLMPSGLLDGKSPQEVADLFAYLETL